MANEKYLGSARFLRQLSSLQRGLIGKPPDAIAVVVVNCRSDVIIVVVTVCKFDENRLVVVDPDGLILIEEVIALSSLVRKLVELRPPVDAPEVVKAALVEDPRLEGVTKLLRDTEDSVRAGVVGLLPGSVVLLIRDIVDDDIVAEVTGEPCGLESSVVGLVVDSETKTLKWKLQLGNCWLLLILVDGMFEYSTD